MDIYYRQDQGEANILPTKFDLKKNVFYPS